MDLSKLPKLSKTERTPAGPEKPQADGERQEVGYSAEHAAAVGAEVWLGVLLAGVLIFFFPRIWQYFLFPSSFTWSFTDKQGAPLEYTRTAFFLVDAGLAGFAIILLLDTVALLMWRSVVLRVVTVAITVLGAVFNFVVFVVVQGEIGSQMMPILAGGFGVYMAIQQWIRLRVMLGAGAKGC